MTKEIKQTKDIQTVIDELAIKVVALDAMADFTGASGSFVHHAAIAALDKHMYLTKNWPLMKQVVVFMKTKLSKYVCF